MASRSSAPLDDIEGEFDCSICLNPLEEPKLLPECLHRLCKGCIEGMIAASRSQKIKCPLCNKEYKIPQNGVDGFRTDFFVKNVLGALQQRKSLETGKDAASQDCIGCGGSDINATFCPEIKGHLCSTCFRENNAVGGAAPVSQIASMYSAVDGDGGPRSTGRGKLPGSSRRPTHPDHVAPIRRAIYATELRTPARPSRIQPAASERRDMREEGSVNVAVIQETSWEVNGFTSVGGGRIVLTGKAAETSAHVSITNMRGETLRKNKLRKLPESQWLPLCHCAAFSKDFTAIASQDGQVGLYDVRSGGLKNVNIRRIFPDWPENRFLTCVATDGASGSIFVGTKSRGGISTEVLVFDGNLNYRRTIMLPRSVGYTRDLSVCGDRFLVCDVKGKNVIAVTVHGQEARLACRFPKPNSVGGEDWSPYRVCTDSRGCIYVLWEAEVSGQLRKTLTQYCRDGGRLMRSLPVDADAADVLTKVTEAGEKLLIVTRSSGKFYVYGFSSVIV